MRILPQLRIGLGLYVSRLRDALWPRSKKISSKDKELHCLIDRLSRVLSEKAVTPGNQIVQVFHNDLVLIGHLSCPGNNVRLEGLVLDCFEATQNFVSQFFFVVSRVRLA